MIYLKGICTSIVHLCLAGQKCCFDCEFPAYFMLWALHIVKFQEQSIEVSHKYIIQSPSPKVIWYPFRTSLILAANCNTPIQVTKRSALELRSRSWALTRELWRERRLYVYLRQKLIVKAINLLLSCEIEIKWWKEKGYWTSFNLDIGGILQLTKVVE